MAIGFKLALSVALVLVADFVTNPPGGVEAVSLSSGSDPSLDPTSPDFDDDQPTLSDQDQIEMLQDRIAKLQSDVSDIVWSFSALAIVAKHPSIMAKLDLDTRDGERDGSRSRRDVDMPPELPTEAPLSGAAGSGSGFLFPTYPGYLGPYGGPNYSGQCFLCPAGTPGPAGPPGPNGQPGRDGRDGRDASLTSPAQTNCTGSPSEPSIPATPSPPQGDSSPGGAVYTRWGKSECADGAELIYTGTIGGAHYTHVGSGANYLCLPNVPIYDEVDSTSALRGLLYSSEYETTTAPNQRIRDVHDHTPVCAVCKAPATRPSVLMVPARNVCPSDAWRVEYAGYLMTAAYTHKRTEFICVDRAFEYEEGTQGNQNGALLYMVEARVLVGGGLPFGPYVDGYEMSCAVCTM